MDDMKHPQGISLSNPLIPHLNIHYSFAAIQNHCSGLLRHVSASFHHHSQNLINPRFSPLTAHLDCALSDLQNQAKNVLAASIWGRGSKTLPAWAWVSQASEKKVRPPVAQMKPSERAALIEERLAGVPVYTLCNTSDEFVMVSDARNGKSVGLFCVKENDANELLEQMKIMDPAMKEGARVVPCSLDKVFQLKLAGVSFRLIPDIAQIKNALREKEKRGDSEKSVIGVPVFKSQSLILRSKKKSYHPFFFRKEDLEKSLRIASDQQGKLNPALRQGDIQVGVLEEIVEGMKEKSRSECEDVVFVPPGLEVVTDRSDRKKRLASPVILG